MQLSVICPVYNEEYYISTCVSSIVNAEYPKDEFEVFFVDGGSTDKTKEILTTYQKQYPWIRIVDNPQRTVPYALNIALRHIKGDVVIRIDAHSSYPEDYFRVLVENIVKLRADNVGVCCIPDVLRKTAKSLAIKEVLCNPFGVGNSLFRLGVNVITEVDTVPFGCWFRSAFAKYGYFDERLVRNQDIEFNKRILRNGGKIYLLPYTHCVYYVRENFLRLFQNNFANGKWNILTVYYTKHLTSISLRHLVPMFFVLSLIPPLLLSVICKYFAHISIASAASYITTFSFVSLRLSLTKKVNFIYTLFAFLVLHISYGIGSMIGLMMVCKLGLKTLFFRQ